MASAPDRKHRSRPNILLGIIQKTSNVMIFLMKIAWAIMETGPESVQRLPIVGHERQT